MSLSDDHTVLVHPDVPEGDDYEFIRRFAGKKIRLPSHEWFAPLPMFMQAHRMLMRFD
jgi:hypothetical protein